MKSLKDLEAIRQRTLQEVGIRNDRKGTRIVVGMATCGIAAGARPVMMKFVEEVANRSLQDVAVSQTGCIGMCEYEPLVEVFAPGQEKVTYVKMTPEKAAKVMSDHIVNGQVVAEYTIGSVKK
ncbi:MAG: (2Fe-2S) ferredoxin domain-containing protein [Christensenellaceae bacterium]|jgi:NADP-reducing hydrogenase subunit HndB|nr:(2Fe-2S) ferredoxin domain-containing protein [Christensenellaceae bacterium]